MKYYAYIPLKDGTEPCGTENRCLFESAGDFWANHMAKRRLNTTNFVLIRYTHLYDEKTYKVITGKYI